VHTVGVKSSGGIRPSLARERGTTVEREDDLVRLQFVTRMAIQFFASLSQGSLVSSL
jgi:hypothetical protein